MTKTFDQVFKTVYKEQLMNSKAWDVIRNGKVIDTVFYNADCDLHYVRKTLIDHDGYPTDIRVVPATR